MGIKHLEIHNDLTLQPATQSLAQFGAFGSSSNPLVTSGNDNNGVFDPSSNNFGGTNRAFFRSQRTLVIAHAVLACMAFVLILPVGGIIIHLASFKGGWLFHGLCQALGCVLYIAAAGMGIYMAINLRVMNQAHAIIGIVLLIALLIQPFTGLLHHVAFRKRFRRTGSSFVHIWLGRLVITVGIINGGLGLWLARGLPFARPRTGAMIGYGIVAGLMWLVYVAVTIAGESRRTKAAKTTSRNSTSTDSSAPAVQQTGREARH
jgi:hypothetical protein